MKPPYGPQCRRAEPIGRGRRPNSATSYNGPSLSPLRSRRIFFAPSRSLLLASAWRSVALPPARSARLSILLPAAPRYTSRAAVSPSPRPSSRRIRLLPVLAPFSPAFSLLRRYCACNANALRRSRARAATHERNFAPRSAPLRFASLRRASRRRHRAMRSRTPWATLRRRESASVVLSVRPPSPEDAAAADRLSRYALYGTLGRRRFAA